MGEFLGKRVIPRHEGDWDKARSYEPLMIVLDPEKDKVAVIRIQGKRRCRNCFPDPEGVGCKGENAAGSFCYGTGRWVEKRVRGGLPATGRSNERRK